MGNGTDKRVCHMLLHNLYCGTCYVQNDLYFTGSSSNTAFRPCCRLHIFPFLKPFVKEKSWRSLFFETSNGWQFKLRLAA